MLSPTAKPPGAYFKGVLSYISQIEGVMLLSSIRPGMLDTKGVAKHALYTQRVKVVIQTPCHFGLPLMETESAEPKSALT